MGQTVMSMRLHRQCNLLILRGFRIILRLLRVFQEDLGSGRRTPVTLAEEHIQTLEVKRVLGTRQEAIGTTILATDAGNDTTEGATLYRSNKRTVTEVRGRDLSGFGLVDLGLVGVGVEAGVPVV